MGLKVTPTVTLGDKAVPQVSSAGCGAVDTNLRIDVTLDVEGFPDLAPEAVAWKTEWGYSFATGSLTTSLALNSDTKVTMTSSYWDSTQARVQVEVTAYSATCLLYTSPSPRDS